MCERPECHAAAVGPVFCDDSQLRDWHARPAFQIGDQLLVGFGLRLVSLALDVVFSKCLLMMRMGYPLSGYPIDAYR